MRKKLARLRWQFVRYNVVLSFLTVLLILILFTYDVESGFLFIFQKKILELPLIVWLLIVILLMGGISGFIQSDSIKKRIDSLLDSTVRYARGSFSHRMESTGDDEITELMEQMNNMASHIEEQVISLQRLSAERAELQETIKKTAVTEERQRLARDLHDAVSQQLFAISMMMAALKESHKQNQSTMHTQIEMVEKMANAAQAEMRALLLHLRPAHLEGKELKEAIHQLIEELKQKQEMLITYEMNVETNIPKGIEEQLYRLTQEAFSNILRHAKASKIEFHLKQLSHELRLRVVDNGVGFQNQEVQNHSYGLQTMKERMNEVGGTLEIVSVPKKGTQIIAKVPITWKEE
ncbi:sensor histidine kinase [Alkalihalobacillus trypoxylicola]|uniref:Sensor histidine kinase n=1 Tax=Alkalihalobacillus trypoxylicola TaxID=519424 RepID=A0A161PGE2_9BACI|nr:sensor histidine kinase [Alkalihalobacillus trypoxylicola]KYG31844.1 histidine kinase [Alkalihalobacillus trypoxylicola]GAF65704.1 hypothetical protein BTS2_2603 [Bacillus sp. TS-2]